MLVAAYEQNGSARDVLRLRDLPDPHPGPGEVRVKLITSGINPSDVKMRQGLPGAALAYPIIVPHSDGAGVIDQVGKGVPQGRLGERVWTWNAGWGRPMGTAAQFVTLPEAQAVTLPDSTDFAAGACLGIPALTAYHATALGSGVRGRSVLIAGGAGAVGHYAIQFAKLLGARQVLTTVSSAEKERLARAAGADDVVNYRSENVPDRVATITRNAGIDRIVEIDLYSNARLDFSIARAEGDIVVVGAGNSDVAIPVMEGLFKNLNMHFFAVYLLARADRERAETGLTAALKSGHLQHNIAARFPLDRIVDAHELVESGSAMGNVVLDIG
ncbi:MAG: NADPH:quinone oxidoreductase [Nevskia sp.]|nr:NADPH:quinone oxidoreductase [Nevskia sp.]